MYQVCTCPQSNLTGGDPNCPIHGHPTESETRYYIDTVDRPDPSVEIPCANPSCASLHERIRGLEEEMARTKYWMKAYLIPRKYGHHPEVSIMDLWKEKELRRRAKEGKDE